MHAGLWGTCWRTRHRLRKTRSRTRSHHAVPRVLQRLHRLRRLRCSLPYKSQERIRATLILCLEEDAKKINEQFLKGTLDENLGVYQEIFARQKPTRGTRWRHGNGTVDLRHAKGNVRLSHCCSKDKMATKLKPSWQKTLMTS